MAKRFINEIAHDCKDVANVDKYSLKCILGVFCQETSLCVQPRALLKKDSL